MSKKLILEYVLFAKPVSVNKAYNSNAFTKRRFLSGEASEQKQIIQVELLKLKDKYSCYRNNELAAEIHWYSNRFFNATYPKAQFKHKRIDLSDITKLLEDAIYPILGLDDSQIFDLKQIKVPSTEEKVVFKIYLYNIHGTD